MLLIGFFYRHNISCCGFSLEAPHQGNSTEYRYPQLRKMKKYLLILLSKSFRKSVFFGSIFFYSGEIFSRQHFEVFFLFFPRFWFFMQIISDISCKLSPLETIFMKCLILFSGKNKKNITNLSSIELTQRVVKIKWKYYFLIVQILWETMCMDLLYIWHDWSKL